MNNETARGENRRHVWRKRFLLNLYIEYKLFDFDKKGTKILERSYFLSIPIFEFRIFNSFLESFADFCVALEAIIDSFPGSC